MKSIWQYLTITVFMILSFQYCTAQDIQMDRPKEIVNTDSTEIQKNIVQDIRNRFGSNIKMRMSSVNSKGIISGLSGFELNKDLTATDPRKRAFQFLEMNKDILRIENPREQFEISQHDPECNDEDCVTLEQVEKGVMVFGGHVEFRFIRDSSGVMEIEGFRSHICPDTRGINTFPAISEERVRQIALGDSICKGFSPSLNPAPFLCIKEYNQVFRLVWLVNIKNINICESKVYDFTIDANDGKVLWAGCYKRP
jgi:Zn-dependent metalloprotease